MSLQTFYITQRNYVEFNKTVVLNTDNVISSYGFGDNYIILYSIKGSDASIFEKLVSTSTIDDGVDSSSPLSATISVFYALSQQENPVDLVIGDDSISWIEDTRFGSMLICNFSGAHKKLYSTLSVDDILSLFSAWILACGVWNDNGVWVDSSIWND